MQIDTRVSDGIAVVSVAGELDIQSSPELAAHLNAPEASAAAHLIVDLTGVSFLDSSGLGTLVAVNRAVTARGARMTLAGPRSNIDRILRISRMSEIIPVFNTVNEAIASSYPAE